jgi:uncharacterized protein YqgC (DUF456 family)
VDLLVWTLAIVLVIIGLVGTLVPLLPGTTLILIGVAVQKLLLPETLTWGVVAWIAAVWVVSILADILCTMAGARFFGGTKWGMAGATGGALAGMFFSLPALLLGTILGAVAAEKLGAKRSNSESLRAGAGAAVGFMLSGVVRFACGGLMVALFLMAALS